MSCYVDVPYLGHAVRATGGIYNHAGALGIPGILIERGGRSLWTEQEAEATVHDVENILRFLGIMRDGRLAKRYTPTEIPEIQYAQAAVGGCWYPAKKPGDLVQPGETLGEVRTVFGELMQRITAEAAGVILYQTCSLAVETGESLVACGKLPTSGS